MSSELIEMKKTQQQLEEKLSKYKNEKKKESHELRKD